MKLNHNYSVKVNNTFIIRLENNQRSCEMADRCAKSCEAIGQPYEFFQAVDGTSGEVLVPHKHDILKLLRLVNPLLTITEQACFLSHFLLWVKCVEIDEPIVILEHDAVMVKPYQQHPFFNMVSYLGGIDQLTYLKPQLPMPPHGQLNENFRFMLRAHAYAIDPLVAKNMVAKVIKTGIHTSADVFIRIDEFAIIQDDIYAYDISGETTISDREDEYHIEHNNTKHLINCL